MIFPHADYTDRIENWELADAFWHADYTDRIENWELNPREDNTYTLSPHLPQITSSKQQNFKTNSTIVLQSWSSKIRISHLQLYISKYKSFVDEKDMSKPLSCCCFAAWQNNGLEIFSLRVVHRHQSQKPNLCPAVIKPMMWISLWISLLGSSRQSSKLAT